MLKNSFRGRCACGVLVPPNMGFVHARKIVCAPCGTTADVRDAERRSKADASGLDYLIEPDVYDDGPGFGRYGFDE